MDAEQARRLLDRHQLGDGIAPVTTLSDIFRVPEALHEHGPGLGDARRVPTRLRRLAREAVARERRDDDVEGVLGASAVCGWVGQRLDDLQLLDDRTRPTVGDDDRQCVFVLGLHVDEVDVQSVDLRDELRIRVELRFDLAPVIVLGPVVGELLDGGELDALRVVGHRLAIRPACGGDAAMKVFERLVREMNAERRNG